MSPTSRVADIKSNVGATRVEFETLNRVAAALEARLAVEPLVP
jgi:hypothetical protein